METWFIIITTLCIATFLKSLFSLFFPAASTKAQKLPPGPVTVPVIGNFLWLRKSFFEIEIILRDLKAKYGPLITLQIGSRPAIFIGSHSLAYQALIQNGAIFSDRPEAVPTSKIFNSNRRSVSSAAYGPTWRLLRRNITSEILHPSRIKSYTKARRWVLGILIQRLLSAQSVSVSGVKVVDHFQYAMFCLLVLMCFGDKLSEKQIKEIESVQRLLLLKFGQVNILNFFPRLGKIIFRRAWTNLLKLREHQESVLIPLIKSRIEAKSQKKDGGEEEVLAYVDTLMNLELPDEKRKFTYSEMVTICGEFLNAGTDTTSTALQWIMANLVKNPSIQAKLYEEITGVAGKPPSPPSAVAPGVDSGLEDEKLLKEEDLQKMPYLKAVVLEGLRRHPPGHFVLPHTVTEDVELGGYVIPKKATVNFMVAEMGWDPKVWEDPMEFKPERFLGAGKAGDDTNGGEIFDLTGSREIKMMPFGAGRRICPGSGLALLHLEYFVANLVWYFEWKPIDGDGVDLSEKQEFTVVMKNPLHAHVSPRVK